MVKNEKTSKRKIRAIETKSKIYESAKQLFKEYGFENVSVDSIVEVAEVSKGAFYVHFASKDALAADLINEYVSEVDLDYKSYIGSFSANAEASDILILLIGKIIDIITNNIGYNNIKTLYKAQITKTINIDTVLGYNRELYQLFNDIIRKGIQQREFTTEIPVDTIVKHLIMAIRGLTYEWCIRYPDFDLKERTVKHLGILLKGIKK